VATPDAVGIAPVKIDVSGPLSVNTTDSATGSVVEVTVTFTVSARPGSALRSRSPSVIGRLDEQPTASRSIVTRPW